MDLSLRPDPADLPELMDAPELDEAVYRRCLADLASVNRVTFTHRATLRWLARATAGRVGFSLLDVAFGQGDLLRAIAGWAAKRGLAADLSGIDLNPKSAAAAGLATPAGLKIAYLTGDVFEYAPAVAPDFIVTSQFTHHLDRGSIIRLLRWLEANAARGWFIADLHRHWLAYFGFPLLARLMRWHRIVRLDGTVSIARSFTRADWESMLAEAGIAAEISWKTPFRYCVSRLK
jgi:2-polyprenyl-3-methyl-5-hydroxy-6-metoxy-1,4-benzoquinol methylase